MEPSKARILGATRDLPYLVKGSESSATDRSAVHMYGTAFERSLTTQKIFVDGYFLGVPSSRPVDV